METHQMRQSPLRYENFKYFSITNGSLHVSDQQQNKFARSQSLYIFPDNYRATLSDRLSSYYGNFRSILLGRRSTYDVDETFPTADDSHPSTFKEKETVAEGKQKLVEKRFEPDNLLTNNQYWIKNTKSNNLAFPFLSKDDVSITCIVTKHCAKANEVSDVRVLFQSVLALI